jgi:hypothetical protein
MGTGPIRGAAGETVDTDEVAVAPLWMANYGFDNVCEYTRHWVRLVSDRERSAEANRQHPIAAEHSHLRTSDGGSLARGVAEARTKAAAEQGVGAKVVAVQPLRWADAAWARVLDAALSSARVTGDDVSEGAELLQVWPAVPVDVSPPQMAPVSRDESRWSSEVGGSAESQRFAALHPGVPIWHVNGDASAWTRVRAARQVFRNHPHSAVLTQLWAVGVPILDVTAPHRSTSLPANQLFEVGAIKATRDWLHSEEAAGRVIRLSSVQAQRLSALTVSPILAVPKQDTGVVRLRLCANLSHPVGRSLDEVDGGRCAVNDSIAYEVLQPCDLASVAWVVTAAAYLRRMAPTGTRIVAARVDLKAYFRQIKVAARDQWRVAHVFEGQTWIHTRHAFGAASAPLYACLFSNAVCDVYAQRCGPEVRPNVFVDDFVVISTDRAADGAVVSLRALFGELGIQENVEKYLAPTSRPVILGVQFDFETGSVMLTDARRQRLQLLLHDVRTTVGRARRDGRYIRVKQVLAVLGGNLAFITPLFPLSPALSTHVWTAAAALEINDVGRVHWRALLWSLEAWTEVLVADGASDRGSVTRWSLLHAPAVPAVGAAYAEIHSDSCNTGWGAVLWPHGAVLDDVWSPSEVDGLTSNARELWAAVLACLVFVPWLRRRGVSIVVLRSDSIVGVCAVAASRCADASLFRPLFCLTLLQWHLGVRILPLHVPGVVNQWPDQLSRKPGAQQLWSRYYRIVTPPQIRSLPWSLSTDWPWTTRLDLALADLGFKAQKWDGGGSSVSHSIATSVTSMPQTLPMFTSGKGSSSSC